MVTASTVQSVSSVRIRGKKVPICRPVATGETYSKAKTCSSWSGPVAEETDAEMLEAGTEAPAFIARRPWFEPTTFRFVVCCDIFLERRHKGRQWSESEGGVEVEDSGGIARQTRPVS